MSESPTAHTESLKVMLACLPTLGFKPKKMDISTAPINMAGDKNNGYTYNFLG